MSPVPPPPSDPATYDIAIHVCLNRIIMAFGGGGVEVPEVATKAITLARLLLSSKLNLAWLPLFSRTVHT